MRNTILGAFFVLIVAAVATAPTVQAQEEADENPWVYVASYKVPWERVDSLVKLFDRYADPFVTYANENGFWLDRRVLIHDTGDEYNVVYETFYDSWEAIREGGWGDAAWQAVEPDSTQREAAIAGFNWVFEGVTHKDNIYRLVVGNP
jgi:hypothetical protein